MALKAELLDCLNSKWDEYLAQICSLSPQEQAAFAWRQGYPRLADLLAHFAAWWRTGMEVVRHHQEDSNYQHPAMDVDAFNARVIRNSRAQPEETVIAEFTAARRELIEFISALSEHDLANEKIARQLRIEIIEHLEEHQ